MSRSIRLSAAYHRIIAMNNLMWHHMSIMGSQITSNVSNHQNNNETSTFHISGPLLGTPLLSDEFPSQRDSSAKCAPISWRHYVSVRYVMCDLLWGSLTGNIYKRANVSRMLANYNIEVNGPVTLPPNGFTILPRHTAQVIVFCKNANHMITNFDRNM